MTWIFDIAEMTESLSELDRTIRQVRLAKLRSWSHKPSFNLRIANLHAGKMCDGHNPHQMAAGDTNVGSRPTNFGPGPALGRCCVSVRSLRQGKIIQSESKEGN